MITKTDNCADVHELCISKEEFERKEQRRESIYSGQIYNRRVGMTMMLHQFFVVIHAEMVVQKLVSSTLG